MTNPQNPPLFDWEFIQQGLNDTHLFTNVTLRDLFAAFALAAQIIQDETAANDPNKAAEWAYVNADAMLAEREREP